MREVEMKQRSGNVDCARFLAAMLIMAHHIYHMGVKGYPFHEAWIYVEFFLLITGYYTAKHYSDRMVENPSKDALQYTIMKFKPLIPYTLIVTILGWCTQGILGIINEGWKWKDFVINFMGDFSFDLLLITESYGHPLIAPLWYLSGLVIMFPLFALLAQIRNRYTKILISIFSILMYYGWAGVTKNRDFPHNMLRIFVGMLLGLLIYEISEICRNQISAKPKLLLTVVELFAFGYPVICCFRNFSEKGYTTTRLYLLCFVVSLLLCVPGFTHTAKIKGKFFTYLGKLSMPIFIIHWYIGTLVSVFAEKFGWSGSIRITTYYTATLVISMLLMYVVNSWNRGNDSGREP